MPLKKGGFIVGNVIQGFLSQDVPFTFYVDATEELQFTSDQERLLEFIAGAPEDVNLSVDKIKQCARITVKRNRLRLCGDSPYVYLADADVMLPEQPVFQSMIQSFEKHPQLGAVGLSYAPESDHLTAGSMMLRRGDYMQIGLLRESTFCACRYIAKRLAKLGMRVVPVKEKALRPRHLRAEYQKGYLEYEEVRYQVSDDGILERSFLEETIQKYDTLFRLFIDD
jgi:hypothetical protein